MVQQVNEPGATIWGSTKAKHTHPVRGCSKQLSQAPTVPSERVLGFPSVASLGTELHRKEDGRRADERQPALSCLSLYQKPPAL